MLKSKWLSIFIGLVVIIAVAVLIRNTFTQNKNSQVLPQNSNITKSAPQISLSATPTPTLTLTPTVSVNSQNVESTTQPSANTTYVPGGPRGQVTCTLVIPPDNATYGQAQFDYNWNNLILGKSGTAKADLCVASGGSSSLMNEVSSVNGSSSSTVGWIILNGYYTITLYDQHGGDLPDCAGPSLSSCVIDTLVPSPSQNHGPQH